MRCLLCELDVRYDIFPVVKGLTQKIGNPWKKVKGEGCHSCNLDT